MRVMESSSSLAESLKILKKMIIGLSHFRDKVKSMP